MGHEELAGAEGGLRISVLNQLSNAAGCSFSTIVVFVVNGVHGQVCDGSVAVGLAAERERGVVGVTLVAEWNRQVESWGRE